MQSTICNKNGDFRVHKNHSTIFPSFKKSKIVGYWSIDGSRQIHWDSSQLRYYTSFKEADVEYDLKVGITKFKKKEYLEDDEKCEHILRWIQRNHNILLDNTESEKWLQPDFILHRRLLSRIVKSPYNPIYGWIICAVKLKGSIYLCPFDTEEMKLDNKNFTEERREKLAWAFQFKQYMLTENPNRKPDLSKAINESEEFHGVYRSCLNNHHLLYDAKMDGLCSDEKLADPLPLDKLKFMDLRTRHYPMTPRQELSWNRYKSLDFWAHSYLTGVEDIICGLRDVHEGVVRRLKKQSVSDLQEISKEFWNAAICMNFGDKFLNFVKDTVKNDYDETIYKFERKKYGNIVVTELEPNSEYAFLPDWYIQLSHE